MRDAETVLNVIRNRGERGLPLEDVYRQLFNPDLYLRAYRRISGNDGATPPGGSEETVDGMSLEKIQSIIEDVRYERHQWTPVRRTYIPKKNGKVRPLGIPTWRDKLLQEVMRSLLEAYYEPQFSDYSHGFRPGRGCHTALTEINRTWKGTKWFIEGDIKGCFDNIDHQVLLAILREKIHDNRFLRLVENLLKAGYLEEWTYRPTLSGTPQGGIVSPILTNIYLDRLDKFVEKTLLPEHNRGTERKINPQHRRMIARAWYCRKTGRVSEARELAKAMRQIPSKDPNDPDFRRLRYIRYADDFLLGFAGPKVEAEEIKRRLGEFLLKEMKLELSPEKTLITHAATQAARFLGYEIVSQHADDRLSGRFRERNINNQIGTRLPADFVEERCARYMKEGKPHHRPELLRDDDFTIVNRYQSEYRGYVQYYVLAPNVGWLNKLRWVMESSLLKTLAAKHKTSATKIARKYKTTVQTEHGPRVCVEVRVDRDGKAPLVARFGGIPLRRRRRAVLEDGPVDRPLYVGHSELIQRLMADECELCGSRQKVQVHHIRKLADLKQKGRREKPLWVQVMAMRRRKTLVLCGACHEAVHAGRPTRQRSTE